MGIYADSSFAYSPSVTGATAQFNPGHMKGSSQFLIVEDPDICNQFFLITTDQDLTNTAQPRLAFSYCVLDATGTNMHLRDEIDYLGTTPTGNSPRQVYGREDVVYAPNISFGVHNTTMHLGATPITLDTDNTKIRYFYVATNSSIFFYKIKNHAIEFVEAVDLITIAFANELNIIGNGASIRIEFLIKSELEVHLNTDGSCGIAFPLKVTRYSLPSRNYIAYIKTDLHGSISNASVTKLLYINDETSTDSKPIKGIEFSRNGNYLYTNFASLNNTQIPLVVYDLSTATPTLVNMTNAINAADYAKISYGQMELGPDGKIYIPGCSNPNNPSSSASTATMQNANQLFALTVNNPSLIASDNPQLASLQAIATIDLMPNNAWFNGTNIYSSSQINSIYCLPTQIDGEPFISNVNFNVSGNSGICRGTSTVLSVNPVLPGVTYHWYHYENGVQVSDGIGSTLQISPNTTTVFYVQASVGSYTCQTQVQQINIGVIENCCNMPQEYAYIFDGTTTAYQISTAGISNFSATANGNIIVVNGTLVIDQDVTFDGMQLLFAPDAEIVVNSGVTMNVINSSVLRARCNQMWKGITLNADPANNTYSYLFINSHSILQDAKIGITSNNGSEIHAEGGVIFNKNRIHLQIQNYPNSPWLGSITDDVTFTCRSIPTVASDANLLYPFGYFNNKSQTGIWLKNMQLATIGSIADQGVLIEFCINGINALNSGLQLSHTIFQHMKPGFSQSSQTDNCAIFMKSNLASPLFVKIGDNPAYANAFYSGTNELKRAIILDGKFYGKVFNNFFSGAEYMLEGIKYKNALLSNPLPEMEISSNTFEKIVSTFISVTDCYQNIYIRHNLMNDSQDINWLTVPNTSFLAKGIMVSYSNLNSSYKKGSVEIKDNRIFAVKTGIDLISSDNNEVTQNLIKLNTANYIDASSMGTGIRLQGCQQNQVTENTVIAQTHDNWWVNGIWLEDCKQNIVSCNAISMAGMGLRFSLLNYSPSLNYTTANTENKIFNNRMHNNKFGFVLTDGAIGDVRGTSVNNEPLGPGNFWTGNYDGQNYFHSFVYAYSTLADWPNLYKANKNRLYSHESGTPFCPQPFYWYGKYLDGVGGYMDIFGYLAHPNYSYTTDLNTLLNPTNSNINDKVSITCSNGNLRSDDLLGKEFLAQSGALNGAAQGQGPAKQAAAWWANYGAYQSFLRDSSLVNIGNNDSLFNAIDTSSMGRLLHIQRLLSTLDFNNIPTLTQLQAEMALQKGSNPLENFISHANEMLAKLGHPDSLPDALTLNDLRNFAMACPTLYGPGVFSCRSLLSKYDSLQTDYLSTCEATDLDAALNGRRGITFAKPRGNEPDFTEESEKQQAKTDAPVFELNLSPNPVNQELRISADNALSIEIFSCEGKLVYANYSLQNPIFMLNGQPWPSGMYQVKIAEANGKVAFSKLHVIH